MESTGRARGRQGVLALHSHKPPILHRDLKSPNLLIDKHWRCKIADFNLSRVMVSSCWLPHVLVALGVPGASTLCAATVVWCAATVVWCGVGEAWLRRTESEADFLHDVAPARHIVLSVTVSARLILSFASKSGGLKPKGS